MFRPGTVDRPLQCVRDWFGDNDRDQQAENASTRPKAAENERRENNDDEERLPHIGIADRGHEQIQGRIRPSLVDKMKERLIHVGIANLSLKCE